MKPLLLICSLLAIVCLAGDTPSAPTTAPSRYHIVTGNMQDAHGKSVPVILRIDTHTGTTFILYENSLTPINGAAESSIVAWHEIDESMTVALRRMSAALSQTNKP